MKTLLSLPAIIFSLAVSQGTKEDHQQLKLNDMTFPVKNISISINASVDSVYEFASNPANFPAWLKFVKSVSQKSKNVWYAETGLGKLEFELVPKNEFGIIDQVVTLPDGTKVKNVLRVIQNNEGTEVIFTLFKLPGKTETEFEKDWQSVEADLKTLKKVMEEKSRPVK